MFSNPQQYVYQVRVGIDSVHLAGRDQALNDTNVLRPQFCPAEMPIPFPKNYGADLPLYLIGIEWHSHRVLEKHTKSLFPLEAIFNRLAQLIAGGQARIAQLLATPAKQIFNHGF